MTFARNIPPDRNLEARMLFTGLLLVFLWGLIAVILAAAGAGLLFIVFVELLLIFLQYWFSDRIALYAMGATEVNAIEAPHLHAMVDRLCGLAEMPKPRVAIADVDMPNAFAAGRNSRHAVVCVTRGLQSRVTDEELEAVLSHEIAHIAHRDVAIITLATSVAVLAGLLTRMSLLGSATSRSRQNRNTPSEATILLVSVIVYTVSFLLIRALSRYRELAADRAGAFLVENPQALATALTKITGEISKIPQRDLRSSEAFNAFFFTPAIGKQQSLSLAHLFATRPPLHQRLEQLKEVEALLAQQRMNS
jgi:heat shock protein HtpX